MKIGFSTLGCPDWNLEGVIALAKQMGYAGVELRGVQGAMHLPTAPALSADPAAVRNLFDEAGVELACLASDASFSARDKHEIADNKAVVREYIELAAAVGAPMVRVLAGHTGAVGWYGFEPRRATLQRIADALCDLAPIAAEHRVTLVIENQGDFADSGVLWHIVDAVSHPAVKACYNPFHGKTALERPTIAVPRLGVRIGMTLVCDGTFDDHGRLLKHTPLGEGDVELRRFVQLLRGIRYEGYLMFAWPKLLFPSLAAPEQVMPDARKYLTELIEEKSAVLSAYKGDKNAPKNAPSTTQTTA
jgi:sugar phosphate isomerase/epimerase